MLVDVLDLSNCNDIPNAYATVKQHLKGEGLNVLINNAGRLERELKIEDVSAERMMGHFQVNTVAPAMIIKVGFYSL